MGNFSARGRQVPARIRLFQVILLTVTSIITYGALVLPELLLQTAVLGPVIEEHPAQGMPRFLERHRTGRRRRCSWWHERVSATCGKINRKAHRNSYTA